MFGSAHHTDEHEHQLERKEEHEEALDNDDVDMMILKIMIMMTTDPLIKDKIRQRLILQQISHDPVPYSYVET